MLVLFSFYANDTANDSKTTSSIRRRIRSIKAICTFQVNISFILEELQTFDIHTGIFQTLVLFEITWKDTRLVWSPSDYGGVTQMPMKKGLFWEPELDINLESLDESDYVKLYSAVVYHDGTVVEVRAGHNEFFCTVDVTLFPFDIHECFSVVYTYQYNIENVKFIPTEGDVVYKPITDNMEWDLHRTRAIPESITYRRNEQVSSIYYYIWIIRRPEFQIINYFVPSLILTSLTGMATFIPPTSQERTCFIITLYLATVFQSSTIIDAVPHSSLFIPYVSMLYLALNVLYAVSVAWSVFSVRISHYSDDSNIPLWIKKLVVKAAKRRKKTDSEKIVMSNNDDVYSIASDNDLSENESNENEINYLDIPCTWLDVTKYLDKRFAVCFFTSVTTLVVAFSITFLITFRAHADDDSIHIH